MPKDQSYNLDTIPEKVDLSIAIFIILLTGAFISYYSFSFKDGNIHSNTDEITELIINENKFIPVAKRNINKVVLGFGVESTKELKNSNSIANIAIESKSVFINDSKTTPTNSIIDQVEDNIQLPTLELVDSSNATVVAIAENNEYDTIQTDPLTSPYVSVQSKNKSCIILIGAFGEESNKTNLLQSLRSKGYDIFETPFKNLTRIGIYYDCDAVDLNDQISLFRKKYAPDALLLKRE